MNKKVKLRHEESLENDAHLEESRSTRRTFASVEALLREDAAALKTPASLRERLQSSITTLSAKRPWWRRFGRPGTTREE